MERGGKYNNNNKKTKKTNKPEQDKCDIGWPAAFVSSSFARHFLFVILFRSFSILCLYIFLFICMYILGWFPSFSRFIKKMNLLNSPSHLERKRELSQDLFT